MNNERRTLTLGSLFDGSGGFPLAGVLSGIRPLWASEVEPFAVRVTTKRLPGMKHYRLWGNGVALPCVWFVLAGIVYCDQLDG
jgi:site-specific DNA-cytosine methylase